MSSAAAYLLTRARSAISISCSAAIISAVDGAGLLAHPLTDSKVKPIIMIIQRTLYKLDLTELLLSNFILGFSLFAFN
jgi:hypothetical protein